MIAGLEEISSGEIRIKDAVSERGSPVQTTSQMVFQSYALYPNMTALVRNITSDFEDLPCSGNGTR
jgi:multiple sugar transport system ATP-binding protein